jgi:hypothetical protein
MKRFVLFIALLVGVNTVFAQIESTRSEFYLGGGGGVNFSSMDFVPSIEQSQKMGIVGGVSLKYISEKHLGLIAELNFVHKGWSETFDPESGFSYSRTLNYLELPFMTHVYFGNKIRFIFNAGPKLSFLLGEDQEMSSALADDLAARREANPDAPIGVQYGSMDEMKRLDYGVIGGLGMELKTDMGDFDLEGRYYFGLADLFTSSRSENAYFSRSAHRIIEAKLTWYFKIH